MSEILKKKQPDSREKAPAESGDPRELSSLLGDIKYGSDRASSAAFQVLQERYAPLLTAEVESFRQDPVFASCDREDLMQEASIVLLLAARRFDEAQTKVTFGLFLKICLRNALISKQRRLRSERKKQSRAAADGAGGQPFVFSEAEAFSAVFFPKNEDEGESPLFLADFDEQTAMRRLAKLFRQTAAARKKAPSALPDTDPAGQDPAGRRFSLSETEKSGRKAADLSEQVRSAPLPSLGMLEKELIPLLTAYEREVFRRFYSGQSYETIAKELSRSEKSVDNALRRIREKWRRVWEKSENPK